MTTLAAAPDDRVELQLLHWNSVSPQLQKLAAQSRRGVSPHPEHASDDACGIRLHVWRVTAAEAVPDAASPHFLAGEDCYIVVLVQRADVDASVADAPGVHGSPDPDGDVSAAPVSPALLASRYEVQPMLKWELLSAPEGEERATASPLATLLLLSGAKCNRLTREIALSACVRLKAFIEMRRAHVATLLGSFPLHTASLDPDEAGPALPALLAILRGAYASSRRSGRDVLSPTRPRHRFGDGTALGRSPRSRSSSTLRRRARSPAVTSAEVAEAQRHLQRAVDSSSDQMRSGARPNGGGGGAATADSNGAAAPEADGVQLPPLPSASARPDDQAAPAPAAPLAGGETGAAAASGPVAPPRSAVARGPSPAAVGRVLRPQAVDSDSPPAQPPATASRASARACVPRIAIGGAAMEATEDPEAIELSRKSAKLARYSAECSAVETWLCVSGAAVARDLPRLLREGVTDVLNMAGEVCPNWHAGRGAVRYHTYCLRDGKAEALAPLLPRILRLMARVRRRGGRLLVHCQQGVSRSVATCVFYLMWRDGVEFREGLRVVREQRGVASPNLGFSCQLIEWGKARAHLWRGESGLLFLLAPQASLSHRPSGADRYAPVLLQDERTRVPCPPSVGLLDSRAAFVLLTRADAWVWVGRDVEEEDAALAAATTAARDLQLMYAAPVSVASAGAESGGERRTEGAAEAAAAVGREAPTPRSGWPAVLYPGEAALRRVGPPGPVSVAFQGAEPAAFWRALAWGAHAEGSAPVGEGEGEDEDAAVVSRRVGPRAALDPLLVGEATVEEREVAAASEDATVQMSRSSILAAAAAKSSGGGAPAAEVPAGEGDGVDSTEDEDEDDEDEDEEEGEEGEREEESSSDNSGGASEGAERGKGAAAVPRLGGMPSGGASVAASAGEGAKWAEGTTSSRSASSAGAGGEEEGEGAVASTATPAAGSSSQEQRGEEEAGTHSKPEAASGPTKLATDGGSGGASPAAAKSPVPSFALPKRKEPYGSDMPSVRVEDSERNGGSTASGSGAPRSPVPSLGSPPAAASSPASPPVRMSFEGLRAPPPTESGALTPRQVASSRDEANVKRLHDDPNYVPSSDDESEGGKGPKPLLYRCPNWQESLGVYDEEDLVPDGVFALVLNPEAIAGRHPGEGEDPPLPVVFVWFGDEVGEAESSQDVASDHAAHAVRAVAGEGAAGDAWAEWLRARGGEAVVAVREGEESDAFWDAFEAGY